MKVLFVDDDIEVEVLAKVIQARHADDKMDLAYNLANACSKIWSQRYDVIVMDIMMPADESAVEGSSDDSGLISGLLLIEKVKHDTDCKNNITPFVLLSGLMPEEHASVEEAQKSYGASFRTKPEHPDDLYEVIKNAAQQR